ncbi:uncharacterized protein LOC105221312 [Zeugodacus cucurbitae]|uniref:CABIT domain-containing protein n=1 Tax=Zeugodacus cucurbitae TaxID=28588 RepID=A0A0A1WY11_ZEUCU|nr:uncharacterized protein LOC105221312 [Zeugodacus cucurbitae]XP_011196474.1 uncharacterized protein LOC105221312 [Zeugodacus cucurbitae]XP_028902077.1 uncharacterized protein LOC105221312 [Zeugodacus cucurbitae]XP_054089184.1 uncharacterized protein LOC105221312 [Zeugodacus cucurbitae]XP_054089185.1 uncharacterized protein LOC105221312 [Zeugodacus cucurbitae]
MAATDGQIILAASRFGDTEPPVYLREFSKQKLPAVAKIVKGQHQNLGVPTLSAPSLQSTALFLSAGKRYQILAQPIKIKEGRKTTNVGAKVLIPETYPGYFELLSEDGRSTRCIDSVLELSKRRNLRVLVRETFRCTQMNRTIHAGEMLTTMNDNGKYLQCKNIKDEIINLPLDTKAKFSPIAKEDSISGVHTVKNLLLKRMPVIVRLVHGSAPKGLKQPFVPELRLLGCVEIDRIFALPMQKDNDLVPVPLNVKIKLQRARNMDQLEHFIEYTRFLEKAQRLLSDARDRLQIVDLKLSEKEKKDSKFSSRNKLPVVMLPSAAVAGGLMENGYVLRKSASCDAYGKGIGSGAGVLTSSEIAEEYNEIDHIYDYVRGLTPLSKGLSRFEPICETPTIKSHHTDSSGNYCSLIRVGAQASNNNNNNNNSLNASSGSNTNHSGGGGGTGSGNNNNNYSSLESVKQTANTNTNSSHNSSNHSHNNNHNTTGGSGGSVGGNHHHHHHHQSHSHNHHHNHPHPHPHPHPHAHPHAHQSGSGAMVNHYHHSHVQEDIKPVPPPIETIPGKKLPEKRQRPTLPKLYLKNTNSAGSNAIPSTTAAAAAAASHHNQHHHSTQTQHTHTGSSTAAVVNATAAAVSAHHAHHYHSKVLTPSNSNNNSGSHAVNGPLSAGIMGPNKECILEPQSPLFHIRYKSLSSLQLTPENTSITATPISSNPKGNQSTAIPPDVVLKCSSILNHQSHHAPHLPPPPPPPLSKSASTAGGLAAVAGLGMGMGVGVIHHNPREGTLDSSRSGGRTSGDSNKLPEKKTRRLSRPRSLSNLVWDLRPSKEKSKKKLYIHHFDHRQQATLYL